MEDKNLNWLIENVGGQRLRRLIPEVWQRLPERDQALLHGVLQISTSPTPQTNGALGWCGVTYSGNEFVFHVGFDASVDSNEVYSDSMVRFLIAHEIAHAVLRHPTVTLLFELGVPDIIRDIAYSIHEDHANMQLIIWKFRQEMIDMFTLDSKRKPAWFEQMSQDLG